eukprot:2685503-Rhodomonas_salina.1
MTRERTQKIQGKNEKTGELRRKKWKKEGGKSGGEGCLEGAGVALCAAEVEELLEHLVRPHPAPRHSVGNHSIGHSIVHSVGQSVARIVGRSVAHRDRTCPARSTLAGTPQDPTTPHDTYTSAPRIIQ